MAVLFGDVWIAEPEKRLWATVLVDGLYHAAIYKRIIEDEFGRLSSSLSFSELQEDYKWVQAQPADDPQPPEFAWVCESLDLSWREVQHHFNVAWREIAPLVDGVLVAPIINVGGATFEPVNPPRPKPSKVGKKININRSMGSVVAQDDTVLLIDDVLERVKLSRSAIYRLISQKRFPAPFRADWRTSGWSEREIDSWLEANPQHRPVAA